ncbi:LamG-like jellyroll fold domain-containing protein [Planctomycetota bacterium]
MALEQRKWLLVLVMAGILGMAESAARGQLIAYWRLDETSGTIAHDSLGNPLHDAIAIVAPYWDSSGILNGCAYFHGLYERFQVPEYPDTPLDCKSGPISLSLWFKVDGAWGQNDQYLAGKGYSYRIYYRASTGRIEWGPYHPPSFPYPPPVPVDDGEWHHVVGTFGGLWPGQPTEKFELYIDGVSQGVRFDSNADPYDTSYEFAMGGSRYSSSIGFKGWIDEVALWGMELNSSQVYDLYKHNLINFPPEVEAGPPQIGARPGNPSARAEFRLNGSVKDDTVLGPNELSFHWEVWDQAPGVNPNPGPVWFSATDWPNFDPCDGMLDGWAWMTVPGVYYLKLTANDGVYEANDFVMIDVRPFGWKGELIAYEFEGNLLDTGADSTADDTLIAYRHYQYNFVEDITDAVIVNHLLPYEEGIVGQALRLEDIDIDPYTSPPPRNDYIDSTGTLLQTAPATVDTALHGYGTFTIEAFIKPDPGIDVLARLMYIDQVEYDDSGANVFAWNIFLDKNPYRIGASFSQKDEYIIQIYPPVYPQVEAEIGVGEWSHIAFTGDGYTIKQWINGFEVASEPYDGTLQDSLNNVDGLRISSEFGKYSFTGLIDEIKISLLPKGAGYMKSRVLLIPLELVIPYDGFQYAALNHLLRWERIKGPIKNPQYEVYLGTDAGDLPLAGTTGELFYTPSLDYDTTYYWYVKPIPGGTQSATWTFKTLPVGYNGLLARWKLDEGSGAVVNDTGTGLNRSGVDWNYYGDIIGTGEPNWIDGWIEEIPRKYAVHFSGAIDETTSNQLNYILVREPNLTDPIPDIEFSDPLIFEDLPLDRYSLTLWFNAGIEGFEHTDATMFSLGDSYALHRSGETNYAAFTAGGAATVGGEDVNAAEAATNVNDAQWHHLAGVYDNINDQVLLYVDGQLEDSAGFDYGDWEDLHTIDREAELWIGGNQRYQGRAFNGEVDDVRVYQHTVLEPNAIEALYNAGYPHQRPVVDAGVHQILAYPQVSTTLDGTVVNDMLAPAAGSTALWTKVDGPGTVNFTPATAEDTSVSFGATGVYTLRLTCLDSAYDSSDEVRIWVQPDIPGDYDNVIAYWRFEADVDGDPLVFEAANEVPFGTSLFNVAHLGDPFEPNFVPRIDPNVPVTPIPLTGATNDYAMGKPIQMHNSNFMKAVAAPYDELVYPEDITVEFYAYFGDEDFEGAGADTTILGYFGSAYDDYEDNYSSGFWITDPRNVIVHYFVDSEIAGRPQLVEVQTNINLCSPDENGDSKGWRHFAWTYDCYYGVSRLFVDGEQAIVTQVDGVQVPPVYFYDGPDNRRLLLSLDSEDLTLNNGLDKSTLIDEVRITAEALLPQDFLIVGDNHCDTLQYGELKGDFNGDCQEDLLDFAIIVSNWLKNSDPYRDK